MPKLHSATTRALAVVASVAIGIDLTAASCGSSPTATGTNNGQDSTPPLCADTWEFDGTRWRNAP